MAKLSDLMDGGIGHFWLDLADVGDEGSALPGHVHLSADGELVLDLLAPQDDFVRIEDSLPQSITAATTAGDAMFLDVLGAQYNTTSRTFAVPTRRYRARAVVFDVPLDRLRTDDPLSVTTFFPGIGDWAGLAGSEDKPVQGPDGYLKSWSVKVRAADAQTERLSRGRTLTLTTHWQVDGPKDRRTIYAPVAFTVTSSRPSHWSTHIQPLLAIQGLVSMAFDGLVLADGGLATMSLNGDERPLATPRWWTARLMQRPPGARAPKSMNEFPSFDLETIGGVPGVRRWITLSQQHPRATGPLVSQHRFGTVNVETQLLEIAAAIEYWVAVHRRGTKWANKIPSTGGAHAAALAGRVGKPFANLVGDAPAWAAKFWSTNNLLKHIPDGQYDGYEVSLLARTGAILLQCALLNRVAGTTKPAQAICASHRHHHTGSRMRELLGAP